MNDTPRLGTFINPHKVAPADWLTNGFGDDYGCFCQCARCGTIARATFTFDFYADKGGEALKCESCTLHNWKPADAVAFQQELERQGHFEKSK